MKKRYTRENTPVYLAEIKRQIWTKNNQPQGNNNRLIKFLKIVFIYLLFFCLIKYNILNNCWIFINNHLKLFYCLIYYILIINLIFTIIYHSIGYFILCIENEIIIDLNKIKIKPIRYLLEGLLVIKKASIDKEKTKRLFLFPIIICLIGVVVFSIIIFI